MSQSFQDVKDQIKKYKEELSRRKKEAKEKICLFLELQNDKKSEKYDEYGDRLDRFDIYVNSIQNRCFGCHQDCKSAHYPRIRFTGSFFLKKKKDL